MELASYRLTASCFARAFNATPPSTSFKPCSTYDSSTRPSHALKKGFARNPALASSLVGHCSLLTRAVVVMGRTDLGAGGRTGSTKITDENRDGMADDAKARPPPPREWPIPTIRRGPNVRAEGGEMPAGGVPLTAG